MLISTSLQFIFVANSKTASTSIEELLNPYCEVKYRGPPKLKHISLSEALQSRPEFSEFFKFGIMRDPIDWIYSWYRYRIGNKVNSPLPKGMTFVEFWERKDWNVIRKDNQKKRLQKDTFCLDDGTVLADVILNFGNLSSDFKEICMHFGVDGNLVHRNVSNNTTALDEAMPLNLQKEVRSFYKEDYDLFRNLEDINARGFSRLKKMNGALT